MTSRFSLLFLGLIAAMTFGLVPRQSDAVFAQPSNADRLPIPSSGTVLTLSGLNFNLNNYMPGEFRGQFSKPPYRMVAVHYPASIARNTITKGVRALDDAIHQTTGPVIVLAHSQGAQVVSHWIREHTNDATAPQANRLTFLLCGNPLRSCGGRGIGRREFGGTIGEPTLTTSPWNVIDVARRYDGWADWPADDRNRLATENAMLGMHSYHVHYDEVDLQDPAHTVWKLGNTTFVLTHETPPLLRRKRDISGSSAQATTAAIESAYTRPSNDSMSASIFPRGYAR